MLCSDNLQTKSGNEPSILVVTEDHRIIFDTKEPVIQAKKIIFKVTEQSIFHFSKKKKRTFLSCPVLSVSKHNQIKLLIIKSF